MPEEHEELASEARRNFMKLATTGSFTAAMVAGAGGMLWSSEAAPRPQAKSATAKRPPSTS